MTNPKSQYERFLEAAQEVGADDDGLAADALMKRLGQTPHEAKPTPARKKASATDDKGKGSH